MKQYVSYVEAVHAYARGLFVAIESDAGLEVGLQSDCAPTCEAFARDPEARKRAAKAGARSLRLYTQARYLEGANPRFYVEERQFPQFL